MSSLEGSRQRWPWLRFASRELEEKYRHYLAETTALQTRIALFVGIMLNVTYTLWDRFVFTHALDRVTIIREVAMNIFLIGGFLLTFRSAMRRHLNLLTVVIVFGCAVFFAGINTLELTPYIFLANGILIFILPFLFVAGQFSTACLGAILGSVPLLAITGATRELDRNYLLFALLVIGTLFVGACAAALLETVRRRAFLLTANLEEERARFRELLVRVLPDTIADRLQRGEVVADTHPVVAVLFADIVGFTSIAGRHRPDVVVTWLTSLFESFDRVIEAHGLEKIKTIGDAYMAAHGLDRVKGDCGRCARAALDLLQVAEGARTPDGKPVQIRVGLHVGPTVAGIVGKKRFLYDLWGDTVNVASRMESSSPPGAILVTEEVRLVLAHDFQFSDGQTREIKGKGSMETWILKGPISEGVKV